VAGHPLVSDRLANADEESLTVKKIWIIAMIMTFAASASMAAAWSHYLNGRYGYSIDIPPGFAQVDEAENGDGGVSTSADGRAKLSVWGAYIMQDSFADEIAWRIDQDKADGWKVTYDRRLPKAASWSGSKGNRIFYARGIPGCDGAAYYFNIEYDRGDLKSYDPIVKRLVKSLQSGC
jgi:hypothetical protein